MAGLLSNPDWIKEMHQVQSAAARPAKRASMPTGMGVNLPNLYTGKSPYSKGLKPGVGGSKMTPMKNYYTGTGANNKVEKYNPTGIANVNGQDSMLHEDEIKMKDGTVIPSIAVRAMGGRDRALASVEQQQLARDQKGMPGLYTGASPDKKVNFSPLSTSAQYAPPTAPAGDITSPVGDPTGATPITKPGTTPDTGLATGGAATGILPDRPTQENVNLNRPSPGFADTGMGDKNITPAPGDVPPRTGKGEFDLSQPVQVDTPPVRAGKGEVDLGLTGTRMEPGTTIDTQPDVKTDEPPDVTPDVTTDDEGAAPGIDRPDYMDEAVSNIRDVMRGESPLMQNIVTRAMQRLSGQQGASEMALRQDLEQQGATGSEARTAMMMDRIISGIDQSQLQGELAEMNIKEAMNAANFLSNLGMQEMGMEESSRQFDENMAFMKEKWAKTEEWNEFDALVNAGDYKGAAAAFETLTGVSMDPAKLEEQYSWKRMQFGTQMVDVALKAGNFEMAGEWASQYLGVDLDFTDQANADAMSKLSQIFATTGLETKIDDPMVQDHINTLMPDATDEEKLAFFNKMRMRQDPIYVATQSISDETIQSMFGEGLEGLEFNGLKGTDAYRAAMSHIMTGGGMRIGADGGVEWDPDNPAWGIVMGAFDSATGTGPGVTPGTTEPPDTTGPGPITTEGTYKIGDQTVDVNGDLRIGQTEYTLSSAQEFDGYNGYQVDGDDGSDYIVTDNDGKILDQAGFESLYATNQDLLYKAALGGNSNALAAIKDRVLLGTRISTRDIERYSSLPDDVRGLVRSTYPKAEPATINNPGGGDFYYWSGNRLPKSGSIVQGASGLFSVKGTETFLDIGDDTSAPEEYEGKVAIIIYTNLETGEERRVTATAANNAGENIYSLL